MRNLVAVGLLLGTACVAPSVGGAQAAEAEIPTALHGIWGTPACNGDAAVAAYFSHGHVGINDEEVAYRPVGTVQAAGDWIRLERDDAVTFVRADAGSLRTAVATVPPPEPEPPRTPPRGQGGQNKPPQARPAPKPRLPLAGPPAENDPPGSWTFTDYERCRSLPASLAITHGEPLAVLTAMDQLRAACGSGMPSGEAACAVGLFRLADVSGNNELSIAELSRLGRVAAYFTTVMSSDSVPVGDVLAAYAGAVVITPLLAKAIVSSFDYDDSGALSLTELMQNRESLFQAADTQAFGAAAKPKVEALIGQLKGAEQMLRLLLP